MLSAAENNMRSAEAQLARLLVVPIDTRFDLTAPTDQPALPPDSAQLIAEAMKERPDLRMRRLQVESADKFASAEHDLKRPTVSMLGTAGYVPAGEAQIPGNYGALGLNIAIPVFNGGLFRARQFEADARAAAEQKGVQNLELQISQDVRDAWLSARNAYDQLQLTQQLFDQAKLALDLAQARYKLGLSSIVELSQSQLQYTNAEIQHTRAGYDYFAQKRVLEFETGLIH
jgi:outer membrane protein